MCVSSKICINIPIQFCKKLPLEWSRLKKGQISHILLDENYSVYVTKSKPVRAKENSKGMSML